MTNVMHKFLSLYLFITLYMFRAHRAHHQERQIVSIQLLVTVILCWWPRCVQVGRILLQQTKKKLFGQSIGPTSALSQVYFIFVLVFCYHKAILNF